MNQNPMLDDASGFGGNQVSTLHELLDKERSPIARLPLMEQILSIRAQVASLGSAQAPRQRMAELYNFDEDRKPAQRKRENAAAMALLAQIDAGDLNPIRLTAEQKATLAKYSGTGGALIGADGKKGSAYEYYTPAPVAQGIWSALSEMGFSGGKVLDPCAGTGIFGATAPETAVVDAVELNETSGRVNQLVNDGPGYKTTISPFEAVAANTPDETYDAIVTNVPFGGVADRGGNQLLDKRYQDEPLQNYFILRGLEKLRDGGLAAFITPPRCVSGKDGAERKLRMQASLMAEFVGAYRLPNSVFGTAAADTMTDVMFFRKYDRATREKIQELREQNPEVLTQSQVLFEEFLDGRYFLGEGRRFVLGEFVAKDPNKFRDVDRVVTNASVGEIGGMLRKLPDSRVNWELLGGTETAPIVYNEGDTLYQAGQCLQMQDGQWVPVQDQRGEVSQESGVALVNMATPYAAFESRIDFASAKRFADGMIATGQALDLPGWLRDVMKQTAAWSAEQQATYWTAGIVGMSVQQVLEERAADEGLDYSQEYAALSDAMQVHCTTAKGAPGAISGRIKLGLKAITTHYSKKSGFSALWRGDVQAQVVNEHALTAQGTFEGLRYQLKSQWVPMDKAKAIFGDDFDPMKDDDWCVSADGASITKASDYYSGGYGDFLRRIDGEIAAATSEALKAKLLRQKLQAESRIERIDVTKLEFNLFSPHVTAEEKAEFLRRFVHESAVVVYDDGKARPDIQIKGKDMSDRDKLMNRIGDYLKNGTITLGGAKLGISDAQALAELRSMVRTANEQFNGWARGNTAIQQRLQATANDPDRLRFERVEDTEPLEIPGMNPALKLHGYQNAFVRQQAREFGGGNGFDVGLGKTFTALACAQYVQSIGVKKKTVFVVPGSVLSNWRKEAMNAYTSIDDCLFVGLRDKRGGGYTVNPSAYDEDLNRIRENRHSKIFMTMEAFERLRLRDDTITRFGTYMRQVDQSFAEVQDKKQDERNKGKAAGFAAVLGEKSGGAPYLEDLGIDSLVSDEAHAFKNSSEVSEFKGGKYLSMAPSAKRGIDMQAKAWYIRGASPAGDGVLLLTASPITNSPLEIYSMLSLAVGHQRVNDMCLGVKGADAFMQMMCQVDSETDVTMDGITRETNVFTGLNNVTALRKAVNTVFTIKTAEDVGAQIVVPDADEQKSPVALASATKDRLKLYKEAFRYAIDVVSEKADPRGSREAFDAVQAHFGEPTELIGHPFNLINKMTMLIADPELDQRSTLYSFLQSKADLAKKVVDKFNAKKVTEDRSRPGPITEEAAIVGRKVTKDSDGNETVTLKVHAKAYINDGRIQIDTIDQDTQSAFEAIAEAEGLDLDVSIPPKLAAMLENYKNEQASPRGVVDGTGARSNIVKQIVFCDILPLHNKIKRILSKHAGVPSASIAIITGQTNNKPEQILEVQDGFNAQGEFNKYRCVIANEKAEVGINLQKGTQAIHHLTIGWTPDSLQQRNGRGVRQGNHTAKVTVYHYDADGTFDSAKRVMVGKKADWIGQVMDAKGGNKVAISGGMSAEQLRMLIDTVGDADAMRRIQDAMDAKEAEQRATNNRERQLINLDTIKKQREYLDANTSALPTIVRKVVGLHNLRQQWGVLQDRISNPKASPTAVAKNEALLAELQARFHGLTKIIDDSCTITYEQYQKDPEQVGAIKFLEAEGRKGRQGGYTKDDELAEKLEGKRYSNYKLEVIEGGPVHAEWELEVGLATRMMQEAVRAFEAQGEETGAFPAATAKKIEAGEGFIYGGKPMVTGAFIRIPQSDGTMALAVYRHGASSYDQKVLASNGSASTERFLHTLQLKDAIVILPGSPEYQSCLAEAAAIEDKSVELGKPLAIYTELVNEVADYRKTAAVRTYSVDSHRLPAPYFPFVIRDTYVQEPGANVLLHIAQSQAAIVKSVTGTEFTAEVTAGVIHDGYQSPWSAVVDYAKANNLKLSIADLKGATLTGSSYGDWLKKGISDAGGAGTLETILQGEFDSVQAVYGALIGWLEGLMPYFDWQEHLGGERASIIEVMLTLASYPMLRAYKAAKAKAQGAPVQPAPASEGNPDDIVAITGNTMAWKGRIKLVAPKFRWDKKAAAWNVHRSSWNELVRRYPDAEKELQIGAGTVHRL